MVKSTVHSETIPDGETTPNMEMLSQRQTITGQCSCYVHVQLHVHTIKLVSAFACGSKERQIKMHLTESMSYMTKQLRQGKGR